VKRTELRESAAGTHALQSRSAGTRDRWRAVAARACGVAFLMTFSPWLDAASERSFAWHMVQHMLLMYIAAPLLLLAWPARAMLRALPPPASRRFARAMHSRLLLAAQHPTVAWLFFAAVLWGTHFTAFYNAALDDPAAHAVEHALYFGAALLFWQPVIGPAPGPSRLPYPMRMAYVMAAVPVGAFLGLALVQTTRPLYQRYVATLGSPAAALADQHAAGVVMWIGGGLIFFVAFMLAGVAWSLAERRLGQRLDALHEGATIIPIARAARLHGRDRDPDVGVRR